MSSFDYGCYLTYFVSGVNYMFDDELGQLVKQAVAPVSTECRVKATTFLSEIQQDPIHPGGRKMAFPGFYCVVIFKNEEERSMFKLAVPTDEDFEKRVHEVLRLVS